MPSKHTDAPKRNVGQYDDTDKLAVSLYASATSAGDTPLNMAVFDQLNAILKELKKLNVYMAIITDTWLDNASVEA